MKKRFAKIIFLVFSSTALIACGNSSNEAENTADTTIKTEVTGTPHEHTYIEDITTGATCDTDGVKTLTCECGDSYTETITATGHIFENYISNNDATYTTDGTETATCVCGETDTRTAAGSMLTYTYTEMDTTMYAQQTVNVRSMPNTDGEKLGGLSTNDEVKVTGQCVETSWYRIEFEGNVAYVSDSYLGNDKVVVQTEAPAQSSSEFPYELYTLYDNGTFFYYYTLYSDGVNKPQYWYDMANTCGAQNITRFSDYDAFMSTIKSMGYVEWNSTSYTINGEKVQMEIRWKW